MVESAGKTFSPEIERALDECTRCHQVCLTGSGHVLRKGGDLADAHHIRLLSDCVELCETNSNFMLRGSPFAKRTAVLCAVICRECADELDGSDDPVIQRCADACRECAVACEAVS